MAYQFTGFFSRAATLDETALKTGHVFRIVHNPFSGCGVLTPDWRPSFEACASYLAALGISEHDWIFVDYVTWAGPVDYVSAFGVRSGVRFGPFEDDEDTAASTFEDALEAFGLEWGIGSYFEPFDQAYWGKV
jgi:hypothetical protein